MQSKSTNELREIKTQGDDKKVKKLINRDCFKFNLPLKA